MKTIKLKSVEKKKIFEKWDLDFVVIGKTTNTNNLTLKFNNKIVDYLKFIDENDFYL